MGIVKLRARGLVYEDTFDGEDLDPRWEVVPNDPTRWSISSGSLRLEHGAGPLYLFFSELTEMKQFVLDVKNDYNPISEEDVGGIVVFSSEDNFISLEEYYDQDKGISQTYPWIRLVRDYNTYHAFWSEDGEIWHVVGSQGFNNMSPLIGLFLKGSTGVPFDIDTIRIVKSPKVTVDSLYAGMKVELVDEFGTVHDVKVCRKGDSKVQFDLSARQIPFVGKFVVTMPDGTTVYDSNSPPLQIWGGDVYDFGLTLDLYFVDDDGQEQKIDDNFEFFLGYLNATADRQYRIVKMVIKNPLQMTANSVHLVLSQYKTDQYSRLVKLSPDSGGSPGDWVDALNYSSIFGGEEEVFWLKIEKESNMSMLTSEVFFGITVTAAFI